jgi:hypothetical protein
MHHLQARFAMFTEEFKEILTFDKDHLAIVEGLSSDFVRSSGKRGAQAEDFARSSNTKHQPLAILGTYGELGASVAEHKSATWLAAFREKCGATWIQRDCLYAVERLESINRQVAKYTVRPQLTTKATRMGNALHAPTNTAAGWRTAVTLVTRNGDG